MIAKKVTDYMESEKDNPKFGQNVVKIMAAVGIVLAAFLWGLLYLSPKWQTGIMDLFIIIGVNILVFTLVGLYAAWEDKNDSTPDNGREE
jgi:hypothetical protein